MLFIYVNEKSEITSVKNGIDVNTTDMIIPFNKLEGIGRTELVKMLKSIDPETECSIKSTKDVVMGQLMIAAASQAIDNVRPVVAPVSRRSQSTNKDRCFDLFDQYDMDNKTQVAEATDAAMELCGMEPGDFRGRRVIQTYQSYYRAALRDGTRQLPAKN